MEFTYDQIVKYGFENYKKAKKCDSCKSKFNIMRTRTHISPNLKGYQCYNCFSETQRAPNIYTHKVPKPFFEQIASGLKKSYIDLANTEYQIGDTLIFQEFDAVNNESTENELVSEITSILDVEDIFTAEDIWEYGINLIDFEKKMIYAYQEESEFKVHDCIDNIDECMIISPRMHNGVDIKYPKWHLVENISHKMLVREINGCPFCLKKITEF